MKPKNKKLETLKEVNKFTRAGKNGKTIYCYKCDNQTIVYHFAWYSLKCEKCKKMIDKNNWNIKN